MPIASNDVQNFTQSLLIQALGSVNKENPNAPSISYLLSLCDWIKIRDLLAGAETVRSKGETYLPRFPAEDQADYETRLKFAPLENHFLDSLTSITTKPFSKLVHLKEGAPSMLDELAEDIDGAGMTLHQFAADLYAEGAAFGWAGIFVDYPVVPDGITLADERRLAPRPYWTLLRAEDILGCNLVRVGPKLVVTELRFRDDQIVPDGFGQKYVPRVRVYRNNGGAVTYELWTLGTSWMKTAEARLAGMREVPFAPFLVGTAERRTGRIIPPLIALADLQIEHLQQSSNLKNVLQFAGFPMLAGNGVVPPQPITDSNGQPIMENGVPKLPKIRVGPGAVLFAPPYPGVTNTKGWEFIEPGAETINALLANLERIEHAIDKLGKKPLTKPSGNVTATSDAINSAEGHATAEAWARDEANVLSRAFGFTLDWMGVTPAKPVLVYVNTDFGLDTNDAADAAELRNLTKDNIISRRTARLELVRRNFLSPDFDVEQEEAQIAAERQELVALNAKLGLQADGSVPPPPKPESVPPKSPAPAKRAA